nr:S8 family serine peptidase [Acidobacteriota bacterium]
MKTKPLSRTRTPFKLAVMLAVLAAVAALSSAGVRGAVREAQVSTWAPKLAKLALLPVTNFMQGPVAGQDTRTVSGAQAKPGVPAQPPAGDGMVSLLVKTAPGLSDQGVDALMTRAGAQRGRGIGALRLHVVRVPAAALEGVMQRFQSDAEVERVEVDQRRKIAQTAPPSDPGHVDQWALETIRWNASWSSVAPIGSARIAVLDTGVSSAGGEISVGAGWSAFGTDPKTDPNGHGTWVASIAAAIGNNSKGVAGVSYTNTSVLPVQVLDVNGEGQDSDVISGVLWAVENKADVILMALSNPGYSQSLQDAIDLAWANGIVVVAAAGNEASSTPTFPAGDAKVVGVAATDQADALWASSNYGKAAFLAAPGVSISGLRPDGSVLSTSGTSASSAFVAGAAALLKIADPSLTNGVIVGRLARNADVAGSQEQTGNGRLNIERALADVSLEEVVPVGAPPEGDGGPFVGPYRAASTATITGTVTSSATGKPPIANATVLCVTNCTEPAVTTNGTGVYSLAVNYAGNATLTIEATAAGYTAQRKTITPGNGSAGSVTLNFELTASCTVPAITAQPTAQSVEYGNSASFSAAATGNPAPTVQWQVSSNGGGIWTNVEGATATTLTLPTPTVSQSSHQYRAVFSNTCQGAQTVNTTGATLSVSAKSVTGNFTTDNKAYDSTTAATVLTRTVTGVLPADAANVNFTGGTATFDSSAVGTGKTVTLTGATLGGTAAGNYSLGTVASWTTMANITARGLTVTADPQTKVYGAADPALTYRVTSGSLLAGDSLSGTLTRVAGDGVGTYAIQLGSLSAGTNYQLTFVGADLTITRRTLAVKAVAQSKEYGTATDPALTYTITSGTLRDGDSLSGSPTRVPGEAVGEYAIQVGTLTAGSNYDLTFTGANLTITARAIAVTADGQTKEYGTTADPALSYKVTSGSLVTGDAFTGSLTRAAGENVGSYAITQGTLALSTNYTLAVTGANLTITAR